MEPNQEATVNDGGSRPSADTGAKKFAVVIKPKGRLFDLDLKEFLSYRDLTFLLVKRDFIARYKQTVLGPAWAVIQPLLTTLVFTVLFGRLAKLTTADTPAMAGLQIPGFLFYMSGTVMWTYFSTVVSDTSRTFIANSAIMGKVYFPRLCVPAATALASLIGYAIQCVMFAVCFVVCAVRGAQIRPDWYILLFPLLVLQLMILSTGCGIIVSALTTKYRDLQMLVQFGVTLWQYATPVAYGLELIPEKWRWLYMLNPVTPVILTMRRALFGEGYFSLTYYLTGWAVTLFVALAGTMLFNRIERNFADTV